MSSKGAILFGYTIDRRNTVSSRWIEIVRNSSFRGIYISSLSVYSARVGKIFIKEFIKEKSRVGSRLIMTIVRE